MKPYEFLLFVTVWLVIFKVMHVVDWSWWVIFLPLYAPVVALLVAFVAVGVALTSFPRPGWGR